MFSSLLEPPVCSKVMSPVEYRSHSGRVHIVQCYAWRAGRLDRVAASRHVEAEVQLQYQLGGLRNVNARYGRYSTIGKSR